MVKMFVCLFVSENMESETAGSDFDGSFSEINDNIRNNIN